MTATAAGASVADPVLERRLARYLAGGWDPLTAPVEWYDSVDPIPGAAREPARGAPVRLAPEALAAALAHAEADGATALLVAESGRLVAERYWGGTTAETRLNPQSMAKTVVALLVGVAIDRGEIGSADDPVGRHVAAWRDDPRGRITLAQLLQMASGLGQVDAGRGWAMTPDNPAVRQYFGSDFDAPMLALPLVARPGERFDYNNNATKLVARALEEASGLSYARLVSERLWKPLGLADASVYVDRPGGRPMASCCLFSRPRDWLGVGRLIAGRGEVDGSRIVSAAWVDRMLAPSPANPGYGFQIWVGDQKVGGERLPPVLTPWQSERFAARDLVLLNGFGGQRVWIMPSADLVVVRMGRTWPKAWDDAAIPNLLHRSLRTP